VVLRVAPGTREVGLAVAMPGHLLDAQVKDLHRIASREQKAARFQNAVLRWIERDAVTRIAVVLSGPTPPAVVADQLAWLRAEAAARGIPLARPGARRSARSWPPAASRATVGSPRSWRASSPSCVAWRRRPSPFPAPTVCPSSRCAGTGPGPTGSGIGRSRAFLALAAARRELRRISNIESQV
jgi:hypothetical protein